MLRSEKNVTINVRNEHGQLTSQLTVGEWTLARLPGGASLTLNIPVVYGILIYCRLWDNL